MKKYIVLLSMICLFASCGDGKVGDSAGELCGGVKCDTGEKCKDSKCVKVVEGELCKKSEVICTDDKTKKVCEKGKNVILEKCGAELKCKEGKCVKEGGDVVDELCKSTGRRCIDSKHEERCEEGKKSEIVECGAGESCRGDQCAGDHLAGIGESCESKECVGSGYCSDESICVERVKVGGGCDSSEQCVEGLDCQEGVCKQVVNLGGSCGEGDFCVGGECIEGVCKKVAGLYEACGGDVVCAVGVSECVDGQCVPLQGACKSHDECSGDRYCCLDDGCGVRKGRCVSFSAEHPSDNSCVFKTKPGVFEAAVQCYWKPDASDNPGSTTVWNTVVVGKMKNKAGIEKPLMAFVSSSPNVIRIVNSEDCKNIESIAVPNFQGSYNGFNNLAVADFNKDGYMELVLMANVPILYQWDEGQQRHVEKYKGSTNNGFSVHSANFSIHDLDGDGVPEIIGCNGSVYNSEMVLISNNTFPVGLYIPPALGDLNQDGKVEMFSEGKLYHWNKDEKKWDLSVSLEVHDSELQVGYADFGTRDGEGFDFEKLDGISEIVLSGRSTLQIWSVFSKDGALINPKQLMKYSFSSPQNWGYPLAIGDFNGDGKSEVGVASRSTFGVYDPKCKAAEVGKCAKQYVVWESATHDQSGIAGASAFDFDGDGKIEIVYGDECYTRVYDGSSGEVLFSSYRNSGTVIEYPTIADVDGDGSTEIVVPSDSYSCSLTLDPSHRGVKCQDNSDCYSKKCVGSLCRCNGNNECNWQQIGGKVFEQYSCTTPLAGDDNGGNVCRASQGPALPGIMVLRDRMDRWVSSRTLWNQHSYSITNINDDGSIPKMGDWLQNFRKGGVNNYRQQLQGKTGTGVAPDITGRFTSGADACKLGEGGKVVVTAQVCNRGTKDVGSKMPAVFYVEEIKADSQLCVSYTDDVVPIGVCRVVSCEISKDVAKGLANKKIVLVVNDDGKGGRTTVECNDKNNTDEIVVKGCGIN